MLLSLRRKVFAAGLMFGFTTAPCSSCLADGHAVWRSVFCGVSCSLARDFGQVARLLVNRDATLLGFLGVAMDSEECVVGLKTCCNPLARPFPIRDAHPAIRHAAAVSMCGLMAKLDDDARDERGWRALVSRWGHKLMDEPASRAIQWLNSTDFPTAEVLATLDRQSRLEAESSDEPEAPTAAAFSHVFGHLATISGNATSAPALARLGESLGTLIYWKDAWDDERSDAQRGQYNALASLGRELARQRVAEAWKGFSETFLGLPVRRQGELVPALLAATGRRHRAFLAMEPPPSENGRRRRRGKNEKNSCLDHCCGGCDCLSSCCECAGKTRTGKGGCVDACIDCGPGDKGCCDCNPCDGCCCCGN